MNLGENHCTQLPVYVQAYSAAQSLVLSETMIHTVAASRWGQP